MKNKKIITIVGLIVLILIILFLRELFIPLDPTAGREITFNIQKGEDITDISSRLKKEKVIGSPFVFNASALISNSYNNLKAGTYNFTSSMSVYEIMNKIRKGEILKEKVTLIEGWNLKDLGNYFQSNDVFSEEKLYELAGKPGKINSFEPRANFPEFKFLENKEEGLSLEGYLFPDTYEIKRNEGLKLIIEKMLSNFENKISGELGAKIRNSDENIHRIITMASILEKEVKDYEDRRVVAGILWKRIRNGWPLQADATLNYITGKTSKDLTKEDLKTDSPYNTYRYYNLPPGPICNPGMESIKAAIDYLNSPYWYYLSTPTGETLFSITLAKHNYNKAKYLK